MLMFLFLFLLCLLLEIEPAARHVMAAGMGPTAKRVG